MPRATIDNVAINYETLGDNGPWFVLTAGGRNSLQVIKNAAERVAAAGHRVLLYDRPNTGASDVNISDAEWEDEMFADLLYKLMAQLGASPAFVGGTAAGNRVSFFMALRHPDAVRGLLLCWPSGGRRACEILANDYYGQYVPVAREGGMAAVSETPYYAERIQLNPDNRERLLNLPVDDFIRTMERWRDGFLASIPLPTLAVTEEQLRSIKLPTLVIPGLLDDPIHGYETGVNLAGLIPDAELHYLPEIRRPADAAGSWLTTALRSRGASPEFPEALVQFAAKVVASEQGAAAR